MRAYTRIPVEKRFWGKVQKTDSCWIWTGGTNGHGYGSLVIDHTGNHRIYAHRLSWIIHYGEILNGLQVLHKCDNPLCVNPEHLFLGTQKDNMDDMMAKGRKAKRIITHCKYGHEFTLENTIRDAEGYKVCRTCSRLRGKRYRDKSHNLHR